MTEGLICLLGNGKSSECIQEIGDELLARNYPNLFCFKGEGNLVIFVPDYYLHNENVGNYIDPSRGSVLIKQFDEARENHEEWHYWL